MPDHAAVPSKVRILLTAGEAYPALERAFLSAQTEIWGSFLVFDLRTRLRSDEARAIGHTWLDLVVHTLNRGVALNIVISDVDPIARPVMHRAAVRNLRLFSAAAAVAAPGAQMTARLARHPARGGMLVRLAFWPLVMMRLRKISRWMNRLAPERRAAALRDMPATAAALRILPDGRLRPRWWHLPQLCPAVHHQKLAVFDRTFLYIGGLDLDERRYDTPQHGRAGRDTWHDLQLMMQGPVVAEAQLHLERFLDVTAGQAEPPRVRRLLRTLSRPRQRAPFHIGPVAVATELRTAHTVLIRRAKRLIYMETQYFRDLGLADDLAAEANLNPDLGLILILPGAPDEVAFDGKRGVDVRLGEALQARAIKTVTQAFGPRLFVGSPALARTAIPDGQSHDGLGRDRLHGAGLIYVHSKVSIFDEAAAIVSSANLNGRSFRWDTEAGVYLNTANDVIDLRQRLMGHWLPRDAGPAAFDLGTAVGEWHRIARTNAGLRPAERQGFLLPYDHSAAERFGRRLPFVPDELV